MAGEGSERRYLEGEAALDGGQADSMARLQETGDWAATWSAVRKLADRKKRHFRPLVPMLGDDGKPLASPQAKANQHQRELMKEFGENCAEFSEVEHLVRVQADRQAAQVGFTKSPADKCALMLFTISPSPSQVVRLGPTPSLRS